MSVWSLRGSPDDQSKRLYELVISAVEANNHFAFMQIILKAIQLVVFHLRPELWIRVHLNYFVLLGYEK